MENILSNWTSLLINNRHVYIRISLTVKRGSYKNDLFYQSFLNDVVIFFNKRDFLCIPEYDIEYHTSENKRIIWDLKIYRGKDIVEENVLYSMLYFYHDLDGISDLKAKDIPVFKFMYGGESISGYWVEGRGLLKIDNNI